MRMAGKILVGLDGHESGNRALDFAKTLAKAMGDSELLVMYVIEWSPWSFQTPEEIEERHMRREEEIAFAQDRVVNPAVSALTSEGFTARGIVHHGDVADCLMDAARKEGAGQIVVGRSSEGGLTRRLFGSSTITLVTQSPVPVTVVG